MPPRGHPAQRAAAPSRARRAREQELDRRRLRELRRAAPAAVLGVVGARAARRPRRRAAPRVRARRGRLERARALQRAATIRARLRVDLLALLAPRLARSPPAPGASSAVPWRGCRREVGAGVERHAVGRQERVQRPAAVAGHRLHGVHVDRVDVGALLAVDLDAHEVLVHQRGDLGVLEGLALHHVAPVAGARSRSRRAAACRARARPRERLVAPRLPVDRVVRRAGAGRARSRRRGGSASEGTDHGLQRDSVPHVPSSRNRDAPRRPGGGRALLARRRVRRAAVLLGPDAARPGDGRAGRGHRSASRRGAAWRTSPWSPRRRARARRRGAHDDLRDRHGRRSRTVNEAYGSVLPVRPAGALDDRRRRAAARRARSRSTRSSRCRTERPTVAEPASSTRPRRAARRERRAAHADAVARARSPSARAAPSR